MSIHLIMKTSYTLTSIFVAVLVAACAYTTRRLSPEVDSVKVNCVDSIVASPYNFLGKRVTVKGTVGELASLEDRRLFLEGSSDSTLIRCDATCNIGGAFPRVKAGSKVEITGLVQELRVDESMLSRFESIFLSRISEYRETNDHDYNHDTIMFLKAIDAGFPGFELGGTSDTLFHEAMDLTREKIAERQRTEGKKYLSIFYIDVVSCKTL